jgi:hypothetical protein
MGIGSYKDAQRYRMRKDKNLTRTFYLDTKRTLDQEPFAWEQVQNISKTDYQTPVTSNEERVLYKEPFYQQPQQLIQDDSASPQVDDIPLYQGVQPGVAIEERMPTYVPPDMLPVTPSTPEIPNPQFKQIELANGGRVKFSEGSKLTGTDKTLEQNIKDDHKAFNDYRKSIGQPIIPLDNDFIKMWQRTRLNSGGSVKKETPKFIPMDLESVAFRLFGNNLDNLTYNEKQTVYDYIDENRNKKAEGGPVDNENFYQSEMPAQNIEETNPEIIIKQAILKEKDSENIKTLNYMLDILREKKNEEQEYKKLQKEKGVRYSEDFPTSSGFGFENVPYEYLKETVKQTLTNPKYFGSNLLKGAAEGTEFLVGQPLQTLFNQEGKNFEFYEPTAGEKLGINKLIEKYTPKNPTTGTLAMGKAAEITGSLSDPFLAYGVGKKILPKKVKKNRKSVEENLIEDLMNGTLKPYSDY